MKITWNKAESTVKPKDVDYESSPTTVYLHKNIVEEDREGTLFYVYDEAKLTPTEFTVYTAEQNRQNNIAIMEALVDIYAKI